MNERMNKRRKNTRFSTYIFIQILMDKRLHLHIHKQKSSNDSKSLRFFFAKRQHANKLCKGRKKKENNKKKLSEEQKKMITDMNRPISWQQRQQPNATQFREMPLLTASYCCIRLLFFFHLDIFVFGDVILVYRSFLIYAFALFSYSNS